MNAAIVTNFVRTSHEGWWLDTSDEACVLHIHPDTGDITAHGRSEVLFDGDNVQCIDVQFAAGRSYLSIVLRDKKSPPHPIGSSRDREHTETWAREVNKFYGRRNGNLALIFGPCWDSPVIKDIADEKRIYFLPGRYVPEVGTYIPELDATIPLWQQAYLKHCETLAREHLRKAAKVNRAQARELDNMDEIRAYSQLASAADRLKLQVRRIISPISYRWMLDGIRYKRGSKIMIPLEMLFETDSRSERIELLQLGSVEYFSVCFHDSHPVGRALADIAKQKAGERLSCHDFYATINRIVSEDSRRVRIVTMQDQSTDDLLKAMIYSTRLHVPEDQFLAVPNTAYFAESIRRSDYIGVADIGEIDDAARRLNEMAHPCEIIRVAYPVPVRVGLAYRKDDPDWGTICEQAWQMTRAEIAENSNLMDDYQRFRTLAERVGITIYPIPAKNY